VCCGLSASVEGDADAFPSEETVSEAEGGGLDTDKDQSQPQSRVQSSLRSRDSFEETRIPAAPGSQKKRLSQPMPPPGMAKMGTLEEATDGGHDSGTTCAYPFTSYCGLG
jgi:hypothetical protein